MHFFLLLMPTSFKDKASEPLLPIRISDLFLYLLSPSGIGIYVLILRYVSFAD
jgi:hypothetical protein